MTDVFAKIFGSDHEPLKSTGPLYLKLRQMLEQAIKNDILRHGEALPPERDLADQAGVSRVTVRKAVDDLVKDGLLVRRHGSGTFVEKPISKVEQSLSHLTSFTEDMARRGLVARAQWLDKGLYAPSPDEIMTLGLSAGVRIARLERLRIADDRPLAIERASISTEFLPDPEAVTTSLYDVLGKIGARPVRAVQRISACNLKETDATLLGVATGSAGLSIERISYLASGRAVELTKSIYRGDAYDFVAELTIAAV